MKEVLLVDYREIFVNMLGKFIDLYSDEAGEAVNISVADNSDSLLEHMTRQEFDLVIANHLIKPRHAGDVFAQMRAQGYQGNLILMSSFNYAQTAQEVQADFYPKNDLKEFKRLIEKNLLKPYVPEPVLL
ncbi:MAG: hypothetical protein ACMXYG_04225 [Candidatus Woesearchaeota archaeon]